MLLKYGMSKDVISLQADKLPNNNKFKPKYTPINQVDALLKKGLTNTQIGKLLGISYVAVGNLIKRHGLNPKEDTAFKKDRADILASKQRLLLNNITVGKIKKMAVRDNVVSFGILYDKERLERGQSGDDSTKTVYQFIKEIKIQMEVGGDRSGVGDTTSENDDSLPPFTSDVTI